MAFQTRDEAQDKVSKKLDRVLNKKKKQVPLSQESWDDLNRRGARRAPWSHPQTCGRWRSRASRGG